MSIAHLALLYLGICIGGMSRVFGMEGDASCSALGEPRCSGNHRLRSEQMLTSQRSKERRGEHGAMVDTWYNVDNGGYTGALVPSSMQYWVGVFVRRASKLRVGQQDGGAPPFLVGCFLLEIQSSCDKLKCF